MEDKLERRRPLGGFEEKTKEDKVEVVGKEKQWNKALDKKFKGYEIRLWWWQSSWGWTKETLYYTVDPFEVWRNYEG